MTARAATGGGQAWTHDALMEDLAGYLRGPDRMVWTDMQLGPSGSPRPDVFTLQKSYSKPCPTAFEIKVSRSDFRADTTSGKWQTYLKFAGSVTFAVPDGLVTLADVPAGCGLIVRKEAVWRYARRPTLQSITPPFSACMKLLIDGVSRCSAPRQPVPRTATAWKEAESVRKKFGEAVDRTARDLLGAQKNVDDLKSTWAYEYERVQKDVAARKEVLLDQARKAVSEYEGAKREVCDWLSIPPDSSVHAVRRALADAKAACNADARVAAAEERLKRARYAVDQAAGLLAPQPEAVAA